MVTGDILKVLEGFHHREARWITGIMATRGAAGSGYLMVVVAVEFSGIHPIMEYIRRQQATIAEKVVC